MAAVVVPALRALDAEITEVAPKRTLPTWFKGDKRHEKSPSGHNPDDTAGSRSEDSDSDSIPEIRAGDYRLPFVAFSAERLVQYLIRECRAGRITWIKYIIFNKRIWHFRDGFLQRTYKGSNTHEHHVHISCKPDSKSENSTKKVGLRAFFFPAKPQKVTMIKVEGQLPELKKDMVDPVPGTTTNYIKRVQTILNWILPGELPLKVDGWYGDATADGLKVAMKGYKMTKADGTVVGKLEWDRLYGL